MKTLTFAYWPTTRLIAAFALLAASVRADGNPNVNSELTLANPDPAARTATYSEGSYDWSCGSKSYNIGSVTIGDTLTLKGKLSPLVSPYDSVDCVVFQVTKKAKITFTPTIQMQLALSDGSKNFPNFGPLTRTLNPGTYTLSMQLLTQSQASYTITIKAVTP